MNGRKVTVTYCDEFGVWPLVANDLSSRLPLKNLQWHPSSQRSERFIPSLEVDLQRFNFEQVPQPLLSAHTTYLNLYFVNCDDNDVYKNKVKKQIKTWVDLIATKKNQEWLIVYVAGQDTKRTNNYLGLKTTVFDKIRADFNQGKRDRCSYIRIVDPDGPSSDLWAAFIEKMKESILASFDMQVLQIQEDTRRLDMQRHMPGWNYCTFFILKEGLAQAFEIMTLYEDALIQYDELEASFFQVLRDKALAWFGHFGATDAGDDCGNILDFKRKDYRDLINKNIISVFDFRCYLFARQTRMLLKLQRIIEVCKRGQLFISSFIPAIRENEDVLVDNFLESWVFSACMNIVNECEPLSTNLIAADPNFIIVYSAVKADLLLTARRQLDKLGIKYKHLPVTEPFSIYLDSKVENINNDEIKSPPAKSKGSMTNEKLLEAINSVEAFDKMYMALSTRGIKSYDACYRPRAALTVHGDIAALKYIRDKLDEAVRIFESMIWRYDEQDWGSIENSLLVKCADSQKRLGKTDQFIESLLTLLKNAKWLSKEDATLYMEELLSNVYKLDADIRRAFSPMFGITVVSIIDEQSTVESSSVEIFIENHLPKSLHCDKLCLRLVGNNPEQIWFDSRDLDLAPGKNKIHLTSKTSTSGNYVVEACEMYVGKLVFTHNFMKDGQKKRILRLNHDMNRLQATVSQPDQICLGEQQQLAVHINTGKTPISNGKVLLESQMEGFSILKTDKVQAVIQTSSQDNENNSKTLELDMLETGEIILPACEPEQNLQLLVAYEGSYTEFEYRLKTTVTYESEGKQREFISAHSIHVTVPLVVTETSIFRETCVFLKVDVSCNGDHPVRILESKLKPSKIYAVENSSAVEKWDLTLFPKQAATFVYKLVKRDNVDHDLKPKVRFYAKYRTLKDEVEASIGAMLEKKLTQHHVTQHFTYVFSKVKEAFLSSVDYVSYGLTDVVHLDAFDAELCESFLLNRDLKTKVELLDLIEEFFEEHEAITVRTIKDNAPKPRTNAILFPLEVPTSKVLHTAELILTDPEKDLLVSEACPCTLRIKQSSDWSLENNDTDNEFYYDIDVDYDNWLLSGKRRLRFISKPGEVFEFPVDLVPLKTGNLLLPTVRVSAISANVSAATVYVNSAQQVLVRAKSKTATFFVEQQQRFLQPQNTTAYAAQDISSPS
ncbi:trafficking protein particle complex subunit 10 [Circinella umbellata]|nr:trafficking protein particle complex subunit 10 [Circinella umbellata]